MPMKSTKIVCTIGPSSEKIEVLREMVKAGMNVARLNFSHGTYENHALLMQNIRTVSKELDVPIAIIQDLQGPKIRVDSKTELFSITEGQEVVIGRDFGLDFPIHESVKSGERILIQDGLIQLKIKQIEGELIFCEAVNSGVVRKHKGINLPDSDIKFPILTEKDKRDLVFGLGADVDYVAVSFVRNKQDVLQIKELIATQSSANSELPLVIAKIERPEAIKNIDEIISVADAIMVARGDMGVELPVEQVPVIQKDIIEKCLKHAKPVIVATQMLESMISNPRPTRAEVSDVANAVIDHTDAVMLSEESAFGNFPIPAVTEMAKIIETIESSRYVGPGYVFEGAEEDKNVATVAYSAGELVKGSEAKAIIGLTQSGLTARMLAHMRPSVPIFMLTDKPKVHRQLCLLRGVYPVLVPSYESVMELLDKAVDEVKARGLVKTGDSVVLVTGRPLGGKANLLESIIIN